MTEPELKDKIVSAIIPIIEPSDELIIIETMGEKPSARKVAERVADALIAAGLTFEPMTFRIVENKPYSYTAREILQTLYRQTHNYYPSIDSYCVSRKVILVKDLEDACKKYGVDLEDEE